MALCGSSDLLINENCTLLQITPDVAHRALKSLPDLSRHKRGFERRKEAPKEGYAIRGPFGKPLSNQRMIAPR